MEFWLPNTAVLCLPNHSMDLYHPKKFLLPPNSIRQLQTPHRGRQTCGRQPTLWENRGVKHLNVFKWTIPQPCDKNLEYFHWNKICKFSQMNTSYSLMFYLKVWTKWPSYKSPHTKHASHGDEKALLKLRSPSCLLTLPWILNSHPHK